MVELIDKAQMIAAHHGAAMRIELRRFGAGNPDRSFEPALQQAHRLQQRRLARTRRPDQRDDLARRHGQVDPAQDVDRLAALREAARQPSGFEDRLEQLRIHAAPVADHRTRRQFVAQRRQNLPDLVGVVRLDLDHADIIAEQQQGLRVLDRHEDILLVVIVQPDLEDRGDLVADDTRHGAERRRLPLRAEQRYVAADGRAQRFGQPAADRDPAAARRHAGERPHHHLVADHRRDVLHPHAADQHRLRPAVIGRRQRLFDHRHRRRDADDLVEQLGAKAVHNAHDDDERRHTEHHRDEADRGDEEDERLPLARQQISPRDHPFIGARIGNGPGVCLSGPPRRRRAKGGSFQFTPPVRRPLLSQIKAERRPNAGPFSRWTLVWPVREATPPTTIQPSFPRRRESRLANVRESSSEPSASGFPPPRK
ncbi:hypothetical protein WR25_25236 [Diploscapter pachys]|uniref:Uncharacterized protein n=1 Tax=Diploscapter pachys TaxID=2018661 RepID=A0A2A2K8W5_9BILA|nr:hypothetical protein WR25_25236 [Diploscapter pachys]